MTQSSGADAAATHGPGRRWWWVGAAAAVVVAVVVISVSVAGGDEPDAQSTSPGVSASPTSSSTASPSAEPSDAASSTSSSAPSSSPSASAPAGQSSAVGAATLPPLGDTPPQVVPLDGTGESAGAVTATVVGIEMVESTASGIGEVAGPAIRVRLGVTNATGAAVQLSGAMVSAYVGADGIPASPVTSDSQTVPFAGEVAPGASAEATYMFSTSATAGDLLSIVVLLDADASVLVFQGAIPAAG